jgi:hypothetical protein
MRSLIITLTYNERAHIERLVPAGLDLLVDDNSPDSASVKVFAADLEHDWMALADTSYEVIVAASGAELGAGEATP